MNDPKRIAIVGFGPTHREAPWDDPAYAKWCMNNSFLFFAKRLSALFEMHDAERRAVAPGYPADYDQRLAELQVPVYMLQKEPAIPNSVAYPIEEVSAHFGRRYFTGSASYMLVLAMWQAETFPRSVAKHIGFWGVDLATGTEYAKERDCLQYWLGRGEERGFTFEFPRGSTLLQAAYDYGYDDAMLTKVGWRLRRRREELAQSIADQQTIVRAQQSLLDQLIGMQSEVTRFEEAETAAPPRGVSFNDFSG